MLHDILMAQNWAILLPAIGLAVGMLIGVLVAIFHERPR